MPLYEYKCRSCGKTFEVIQKFSDEPLRIHADCGGEPERLLSAPAFHLKGSGWYATDYAKASAAPPKSGESKSDSSSSENGAGKSANGSGSGDSKPAASESTPVSKPESKSDGGSSSSDSK